LITEQQKRIMDLAEIEFEDVRDGDVITFDYFDQGYGIKSWIYLYAEDGRLKDIKCGKKIPETEKRPVRPSLRKSEAQVSADVYKEEQKINKVKKIKKVPIIPQPTILTTPAQPAKVGKVKQKRNVSPEERAKRAERMRATVQRYWADKKAKALLE
jgi:hypothetical protein